MLTVTENAQTLVKALTEQAEIADAGGVRLAPGETPGQLEVSLVPGPQPGDQVVEESGARVFVQEQAAPMLDDSTLGAEAGEQPTFTLTQE